MVGGSTAKQSGGGHASPLIKKSAIPVLLCFIPLKKGAEEGSVLIWIIWQHPIQIAFGHPSIALLGFCRKLFQ